MMSKRAFLIFRGLAVHLMASFPGLGPSVWHAPDAIDSWHSAAPHSREKVLGFYVALNSGPPPISESTSTVQTTSFWLFWRSPCQGYRSRQRLPLDRPEAPPEWVYLGVYLLLAVLRFRFTYVSLDLLSRSPHSRPFQVLPRTARCC